MFWDILDMISNILNINFPENKNNGFKIKGEKKYIFEVIKKVFVYCIFILLICITLFLFYQAFSDSL